MRIRAAWTLTLVLALAVVLTGCGPSKADQAAEQKATCFAAEKRIKVAFDLVYADSGIYPDMANVLKELDAKCPAGGTYTFDPVADTVTCSVHGRP
jgi:hypothetical protein